MQEVDDDMFADNVKEGHVIVKPLVGLELGESTTVPAKFSLLVRLTLIRPSDAPRSKLAGVAIEIVKSPTWVSPLAEWEAAPIAPVPVIATE